MSFGLEDRYAKLSLADEEDGGLELQEEPEERKLKVFRCCLVVQFLTDKNVDFTAMKNMLSSLWRPVKGMCIKELGPNLFLFQFFHELDMRRVITGEPWTFNQHLLVAKWLDKNEQPCHIPFFHVNL